MPALPFDVAGARKNIIGRGKQKRAIAADSNYIMNCHLLQIAAEMLKSERAAKRRDFATASGHWQKTAAHED